MIEQSPDSADLLISILPMHAERIYSGTKIFELRKVLPKNLPRRIFLYETEKGLITGHVIVGKIISAAPDALWSVTGARGTTRDRFFSYFSEKTIGHAFKIAAAVKYKSPISLSGLSEGQAHAVPQSFFYMDGFPKLHEVLKSKALSEAFAKCRTPFMFRPIERNNRDEFVRLVDRHISRSYSETGKRYAKTLLRVHDLGKDTEGIFSLRKIILEIIYQKGVAGFCVLTEKMGGCVKTGPVFLGSRYRKKGFGQKLRKQLHAAAFAAGFRKVYCTVPSINDGAVGYLLASNYKIEAHLKKQYHDDHNEFVFGYSLTNDRGASREYARPNTPARDFFRLKDQSLSVAAFMQHEFSEGYCRLPNDWAARQLEAATANGGSRSQFKPREIYVAQAGDDILSVALCLPKRGGSTKILLASGTAHLDSLARLISMIETESKKLRPVARKLYSLVSTLDVALQRALYQMGFRCEGILDRPYRSSDDLMVLSKMLGTALDTPTE